MKTGSNDSVCCSPLTAPALSVGEADGTATILKALADRHRVRIVNLLANSDSPVCVCDVTTHVGLSQPTTSFHLKKLMDAGLLNREQRGTWAFYSLDRSVLERLREIFEAKEVA